MNHELPSEEEFLAWLSHPVTQSFRVLLEHWKEGLKEQWAQGGFQSEDYEVTLQANNQALGQVRLLTELIELDYTSFSEGTA